mmetsp:Transcript_45145/g.121691  ORF Transcript_45145/g.121691 Transcript_45145/m.121691 type:complete len:223 (+) Transcript_45145:1214-1882(+)
MGGPHQVLHHRQVRQFQRVVERLRVQRLPVAPVASDRVHLRRPPGHAEGVELVRRVSGDNLKAQLHEDRARRLVVLGLARPGQHVEVLPRHGLLEPLPGGALELLLRGQAEPTPHRLVDRQARDWELHEAQEVVAGQEVLIHDPQLHDVVGRMDRNLFRAVPLGLKGAFHRRRALQLVVFHQDDDIRVGRCLRHEVLVRGDEPGGLHQGDMKHCVVGQLVPR